MNNRLPGSRFPGSRHLDWRDENELLPFHNSIFTILVYIPWSNSRFAFQCSISGRSSERPCPAYDHDMIDKGEPWSTVGTLDNADSQSNGRLYPGHWKKSLLKCWKSYWYFCLLYRAEVSFWDYDKVLRIVNMWNCIY